MLAFISLATYQQVKPFKFDRQPVNITIAYGCGKLRIDKFARESYIRIVRF
jgi:hypothetical protein